MLEPGTLSRWTLRQRLGVKSMTRGIIATTAVISICLAQQLAALLLVLIWSADIGDPGFVPGQHQGQLLMAEFLIGIGLVVAGLAMPFLASLGNPPARRWGSLILAVICDVIILAGFWCLLLFVSQTSSRDVHFALTDWGGSREEVENIRSQFSDLANLTAGLGMWVTILALAPLVLMGLWQFLASRLHTRTKPSEEST